METTFSNVTITIPAIDSREAYAILCTALAKIGAEWETDTYTTSETDDRYQPTLNLMIESL